MSEASGCSSDHRWAVHLQDPHKTGRVSLCPCLIHLVGCGLSPINKQCLCPENENRSQWQLPIHSSWAPNTQLRRWEIWMNILFINLSLIANWVISINTLSCQIPFGPIEISVVSEVPLSTSLVTCTLIFLILDHESNYQEL